ncbi:hypothetical protein PPS11_37010 [Pseudomonas putida S11]|nr:hypothetical protein PPS11_37010 [Pseudomonas putida S11]
MTTLTRTLTTFDRFGTWSADLPLRLFLAWEFFESGWEKFNGSNWFADLQANFPFPFNLLPAELNWQLSMWAELILPLLLLLGLGTRLASLGLMVVTVVAIAAVHWPAHWSSLAELAPRVCDYRPGLWQLQVAADLPGGVAATAAERGWAVEPGSLAQRAVLQVILPGSALQPIAAVRRHDKPACVFKVS